MLGVDNVFEDLGFDAQEALNLKVRADLMLDLRAYLQKAGWTQKEAAEVLGETQARISDLMHGEISRFSIENLINLASKLGVEVKIEEILHAI